MWRGGSQQESAQGFPLSRTSAQAFAQDSGATFPCGRREEATLEFTHGHWGGTSIRDFDWTVFLVGCTSALCGKRLERSTDPSPN